MLFFPEAGKQSGNRSVGHAKKAGIQNRTSRDKGTKCHLITKGWQSFSFDVSFGADDKAPQPVNGHGPAHPHQGTSRAARASTSLGPSLTPDCACLQSDQVFRNKARFVEGGHSALCHLPVFCSRKGSRYMTELPTAEAPSLLSSAFRPRLAEQRVV